MRFIIKNKDVLENCLKAIQEIKPEDNMQVEIKPYISKRSLDQNALYWAIMEQFVENAKSLISESTGYTKDELEQIFSEHFGIQIYSDEPPTKDDWHDIIRLKFLPINFRIVDGMKLAELTSTTTLNKKQFREYIQNIELYALECGVKLEYEEEFLYLLED